MSMLKTAFLHWVSLRKAILTAMLVLFAVTVLHAQSKPVAQPQRAVVKIEIPDMPRNKAKKQSVATAVKPAATSLKGPQLPMTQKYVRSGLMMVPVMNPLPVRRIPGTVIQLERADLLSHDVTINPDVQVFTGRVRFRHEGARLFCDSALLNQKTNSLYAYGNVHMEQGDTLFLYGAWMYYDGMNKLAQVREKVRLENRNVTLFTDSLNYDRNSNIGYFFDGGLLVDDKNHLSSEYGQYSPQTKLANFRNDVKLVHPKFVLTNKELVYNTITHEADIKVPTDIVSDSGYVYTSNGKYNTSNDRCVLYDRSYVISDHRKLTGDTVTYNQKTSVGEAFGNVVLVDTVQQITMLGNYGFSNEKAGLALMAGQALLMEHSTKDTLWLHADTLQTQQDSIYRSVKAFYGARFYRSDFQGMCDSMFYSTRDSVLSFSYDPVLWSEKQQITGEFIQLHTKNNRPDLLHIQRAAMLISQEADSLFDQTSGKDLKAYFNDSNQVVKVEIRGNAETVYLPRDSKQLITGLNRLEGSSLDLYRHDEKIKKIVVWPEPKGKYYPLGLLDPTARYLDNFVWYSDARPTTPEDIFRPYQTKAMQERAELREKNRKQVLQAAAGRKAKEAAVDKTSGSVKNKKAKNRRR